MKTIIYILIFSCLSLAKDIPQLDTNIQTGQEQRDIKTKADFDELISSLKGAIDMGQTNPYSYYLGAIYLSDFNVTDGFIEKDIDKAKMYFIMSLQDKNYAAAYQLAMIELYKKNSDSALFSIDDALNRMSEDKEIENEKAKSIRVFLSTTFSTIVLEHKSNDKEAIERAIELLHREENNTKLPTVLFILANLYYLDGKSEKANEILNKSCKSDKKVLDPRLKMMCHQFIVNFKKEEK